MRKRALMLAPLAALVLGLGAVGCDEPRADALRAGCVTKDLKWKAVVLKKTGKPGGYRTGRLSAVNTGANDCVFRGFPSVLVNVGKGPEANGRGYGRARPVSLPSGSGVAIDLRYKTAGKAEAEFGCLVESDSVWVTAPKDENGGVRIPVRDEAGRHARFQICDDTVRMMPPRRMSGK
ncbi:DUF4232 domain-containing protein [Streptomyces sp. NPDC003077]|uniref:DUF4232 domain-containing protein n=1 Tax=Streptomyces sp. NPDC003077 TaxID=3154443 RepID=UPI0033A5ACA8